VQLRSWALLVSTFGAVIAVAACSSSSFETVNASGGFAGSGGVGGASTEPSSPPTAGRAPSSSQRCPPEPPTATYCGSIPAGGCGYGPDVRNECNDHYDCDGTKWVHTQPACMNDCPKSYYDIAQGAACPDSNVGCSYDEGTCGCVASGPTPTPPDGGASDAATDGGDGGTKPPPTPGTWVCVAPPTTAGCPSARPRELDDCVKPVTCDYGSCPLGKNLHYECTQLTWLRSQTVDQACAADP
jgi:hypothetical protein